MSRPDNQQAAPLVEQIARAMVAENTNADPDAFAVGYSLPDGSPARFWHVCVPGARAALPLVLAAAVKVAEDYRMGEVVLRDRACERGDQEDATAHATMMHAADAIIAGIMKLDPEHTPDRRP